jgi:hypothetical protein
MGKFEPLTCQAADALGSGDLSFYFCDLYAAMQHKPAGRRPFRAPLPQTQFNEIMCLLRDLIGDG